jgi:ABC-2 type transport system permease protein
MTTGTVFDIGYQNYKGEREGRARGRLAVYKDGVRIALGLGRGGKAKVLPWLFMSVLTGVALVMALVAGAAVRLGGPDAREQVPSISDYNGVSSIIMFVFAALVGPELLCRDRRDGVINLYLVRPLTGTDYIVSRWLAFLTIMTIALWTPQAVLFFGLTMGDLKPLEYFKENWLDIPRFLAAGVVMALYSVTLALLTASFTTRRAYASVFMVGLFLITTPFTIGLAAEIGGKAGQWISMFNLWNIPVHVNDVIFAKASEVTEHAPARELPEWMRVGWYFLWVIVPGTVLWARYRKLSP